MRVVITSSASTCRRSHGLIVTTNTCFDHAPTPLLSSKVNSPGLPSLGFRSKDEPMTHMEHEQVRTSRRALFHCKSGCRSTAVRGYAQSTGHRNPKCLQAKAPEEVLFGDALETSFRIQRALALFPSFIIIASCHHATSMTPWSIRIEGVGEPVDDNAGRNLLCTVAEEAV